MCDMTWTRMSLFFFYVFSNFLFLASPILMHGLNCVILPESPLNHTSLLFMQDLHSCPAQSPDNFKGQLK